MKLVKYLIVLSSWIFLFVLPIFIVVTRAYSDKRTSALDQYQTLVQSLQKTAMNQVKDFPFLRLRKTFFETKRDPSYGDLKKEVREALLKEDYSAAIKHTQKFLSENYTSSWAHTMKAYSHEKLKQAEKGDFHRQVANGLVRSILDSGDGKSFNTAWKVLNVNEEYELLAGAFKIFKVDRQDLIGEKGSFYDVLTVNSKDGLENTFYFDITEFHNRQCIELTGKACK